MRPAPQITINEDSFVPLTEQIRRVISERVSSGALSAGERLPTVRQLARDLRIAPGTVAKAYQALETDGVVRTRGRNGTFITERKPRKLPADDALREAARRYLAEARRLGRSTAQAVITVQEIAR